MKDFKLQNGDITISEGGVKEVGGAEKIAQDLTRLLTNELGFNRFHPTLGSKLDGYINAPANAGVMHEIRQRTREVLRNYQNYQLAEIRERIEGVGDKLVAIGLSEPASIIKEWEGVDVYRDGASIRVRIRFSTFTDEHSGFTLAVST